MCARETTTINCWAKPFWPHSDSVCYTYRNDNRMDIAGFHYKYTSFHSSFCRLSESIDIHKCRYLYFFCLLIGSNPVRLVQHSFRPFSFARQPLV